MSTTITSHPQLSDHGIDRHELENWVTKLDLTKLSFGERLMLVKMRLISENELADSVSIRHDGVLTHQLNDDESASLVRIMSSD